MTEVSAVPTCRRRAASGTGAHFRSCGRDHPTITVPLDPKNPRTRPGSPIYIFLHAPLIGEGADQTKQHGKGSGSNCVIGCHGLRFADRRGRCSDIG
jgi:hypothetical protein